MAAFAELGYGAWLTTAVVGLVLALLVLERLAPHKVLAGAVVVLTAGGVLSPREALAGCVNTAVLALGVLFVLVGALRATGAIRWLGAWVMGRPRGMLLAQARLIAVASTVSAFINNTPVVAMLTAAVEEWSRQARTSASRLLLPLSYATILGGLCTLIGTSTNLIVLGLMKAHPELPVLHMFDPARVGLPIALCGGVYLLTVGRWLLPERRSALEQARQTREYVLEMRADASGPLVGRSLFDAGLRNLAGAFLVEVQRGGGVLPAVTPATVLQGGDQLVFVGVADGLSQLRQLRGLQHATDEVFKVDGGLGRQFVEVVVSRMAPVVGKSLRDARFRNRYGAVVVAVNRHGRQLAQKPGDVVVQAGDTLLLEATPGFLAEYGQSRDFLMVNLIDGQPPVHTRRAATALAILGGMIVANAFFGVDILLSATVAALAVLATGCIGLRDARRSIDLRLLVVIASAFALGTAVASTGLAAAVAATLQRWGGGDPMTTLVLVYVLTVLFTELLSHSAAAILVFPIGLAAAQQLGVHPMPFVMAVMVGASASFMTPLGYQTNMMVYGPGGYRFTDYLRVGTPLSILVGTVALVLIPRVWPF